MRDSVTALILAGGKGSRLRSAPSPDGVPKAAYSFRGETLLGRRVRMLEPYVQGIVIAATRPEDLPAGPYTVVADRPAGGGPLAALRAGLEASESDWVFATACDMPFFSAPLFARLWSRRHGVQAVLPRHGGGELLEPLFAFYQRECLSAVRAALDGGRRRLASFLPHVAVGYLEEREIRLHDPDMLSFLNINTPEDARRALAVPDG